MNLKTAALTRTANRALWLTAGVLVSLVMFRGEPLHGQPGVGDAAKARAGVVSSAGAFTIMTSASINQDILVLIDGRSERMEVYEVDNRGAMQAVQSFSLPQMFQEARAGRGQ